MIKAHKSDMQSDIINAMSVCCPVCGHDYIHFATDPMQELAGTALAIATENWVKGPLLSILFTGECGSEFRISFGFHKGQMLIGRAVTKSCRLDYSTYIRSDEWRETATAAKVRADWRCQVCNRPSTDVTLDAHHRTYERLGHELPEDITVLCRDCHELYESNKAHRNGRKL